MRCDEIGVGVTRDEFVNFLNGVGSGQYFFIKKYRNDHNEVANHILRFGVSYPNIKARDIRLVKSVLAGDKPLTIKVTHGVWVPPEKLTQFDPEAHAEGKDLVWATIKYDHVLSSGTTVGVSRTGHVDLLDVETFSNRKGKKDEARIQATISYALPSDHPLVVAALGGEDLIGTVLQGLCNPAPVEQGYEKEGKSSYSKVDADGVECWYLRDILRISKTVVEQGDYPFKASLPINATKDAFRSQFLLTGRYGSFKLKQGAFESINIDGQVVMLGEDADESVYLALPETVKEFAGVV